MAQPQTLTASYVKDMIEVLMQLDEVLSNARRDSLHSYEAGTLRVAEAYTLSLKIHLGFVATDCELIEKRAQNENK